jgi:hypothetical protein
VIASIIFNITSIGCIVVYTILNTSLAIVTIIMDVPNILAYINNILSLIDCKVRSIDFPLIYTLKNYIRATSCLNYA